MKNNSLATRCLLYPGRIQREVVEVSYLFLVPVSLALAIVALLAFLWSLRSEQYEDLDGAAERILINEDFPIVDAESTAEESDKR